MPWETCKRFKKCRPNSPMLTVTFLYKNVREFMPQFCKVFEKRLNVFTFPIKSVRFNNKRLFTDLKPIFRGNVSFNYVNPSLFILNSRNSVFDLKMARPENIFQKRHKNKQ